MGGSVWPFLVKNAIFGKCSDWLETPLKRCASTRAFEWCNRRVIWRPTSKVMAKKPKSSRAWKFGLFFQIAIWPEWTRLFSVTSDTYLKGRVQGLQIRQEDFDDFGLLAITFVGHGLTCQLDHPKALVEAHLFRQVSSQSEHFPKIVFLAGKGQTGPRRTTPTNRVSSFSHYIFWSPSQTPPKNVMGFSDTPPTI